MLYLYYKSVLGPKLRGIAFSSDFKHKNSPQTHIKVTHATFKAHHENVVGKLPL